MISFFRKMTYSLLVFVDILRNYIDLSKTRKTFKDKTLG